MSTAGMPAATVHMGSSHCSAAATVGHAATTPPATGYVIERYWASLKCYVLSINLKGTKYYFYYPYGIILPC